MVTFEVGLNAFCIMILLQGYAGLGVKCGGLNINDPTDSYIWMLGHQGMALLKED